MSRLSKVFAAELDGINAKLIEVETDINVGLHSFTIVGLADKALSEAKERVNSALKNINVKPPNRENRRIVVNLAPADIKKTGSHYDLSIAIGYLLATEQLKPVDISRCLFLGELSLEGGLRPINGALNIATLAKKCGFTTLFVPKTNAQEAATVRDLKIIPIKNLLELIDHLEKRTVISPQPYTKLTAATETPFADISEIKGQESAKRALMIAASGGHNLLMSGSPGTGKTMLAQALNSIMPPPTLDEMIEITKIYSSAKLLNESSLINYRPFRSPHQTASPAAIIGGGQIPRPGEISLAHRGVLFLDELPEFRRDILEALRQPLESGSAIISRVRGNLTFPAKFMLIAAMNPCPCGYYGDEEKACTCAAYEIMRYQKKISGPLLDRIDIQINVPRVKIKELRERDRDHEERDRLKAQVVSARARQTERLKTIPGKFTNSELSSKECDDHIKLTPRAEQFIKDVFDKSLISARGYYRILKVAQTIADLEDSEHVTEDHLAEAFNYRIREKN